LFACDNERTLTVQACLIRIFRHYGLPRAILCDNGPPCVRSEEAYTELAVWLMRLGIRVLHGRPYHSQTQGKEERFHRTLREEVLWDRFAGLPQCQQRFDVWRSEYNWERPHHALNLEVPGSRYKPSPLGIRKRCEDRSTAARVWKYEESIRTERSGCGTRAGK